MAGFVKRFAEDCSISEPYAYNLNSRRKNLPRGVKNFSCHAWEALLSAPEELREEIVSSDKPTMKNEIKLK